MATMNNSWKNLPTKLLPPIMDAIHELGFESMTPVQAACMPLFLSYKDVAVEAVPGSGKTLAFLIPIIQILLRRETLLKKHDIGALIISLNPELATQIHEVLQTFLKHSKHLTSLLLVGGRNLKADLQAFSYSGGHIIVCTPGRLKDLLKKRTESSPSLSAGLKALEVLVLDEADRLLDCGFKTTLDTVLAYLPKFRQTGIFSATPIDDIINLIRASMRNPVQVKVKDDTSESNTPATLQKFFIAAEVKTKFGLLVTLLRQRLNKKTMVFFSTCACVEYFGKILKVVFKDTKVLLIHGQMKSRRFKIFDSFRKVKSGILICTNVMCRGVDIPAIPKVDWVIQYDPPTSATFFVHCWGRPVKNGEIGSVILILLPNELDYVTFLNVNQDVTLEEMPTIPNVPDLLNEMRDIQSSDKSIMDKANRAYVSHIQAYIKHECSLFINLQNLNLGHLATGFGVF